MAQREIDKMSDEELFSSWGEWITRTAGELIEVFQHRFLFNSIREMFDHNPKLHTESGQFVMEWQAKLYGRDVLLFVRREFDTQPGTNNTLKLLGEMQARPNILTRSRYRAFFDSLEMSQEAKDGLANNWFNTFTLIGDGSSSTDYLDPVGIGAERDALNDKIKTVLLYANRNLAHRTPEWEMPNITVPTDTDNALHAVQGCFDKFYPLLTGKSMPDPTPAIQFDWEDSFRHAWMTPEVADRINAAEEAGRRAKSQAALQGIENRPHD
jgi:hypothetical protein